MPENYLVDVEHENNENQTKRTRTQIFAVVIKKKKKNWILPPDPKFPLVGLVCLRRRIEIKSIKKKKKSRFGVFGTEKFQQRDFATLVHSTDLHQSIDEVIRMDFDESPSSGHIRSMIDAIDESFSCTRNSIGDFAGCAIDLRRFLKCHCHYNIGLSAWDVRFLLSGYFSRESHVANDMISTFGLPVSICNLSSPRQHFPNNLPILLACRQNDVFMLFTICPIECDWCEVNGFSRTQTRHAVVRFGSCSNAIYPWQMVGAMFIVALRCIAPARRQFPYFSTCFWIPLTRGTMTRCAAKNDDTANMNMACRKE